MSEIDLRTVNPLDPCLGCDKLEAALQKAQEKNKMLREAAEGVVRHATVGHPVKPGLDVPVVFMVYKHDFEKLEQALSSTQAEEKGQ